MAGGAPGRRLSTTTAGPSAYGNMIQASSYQSGVGMPTVCTDGLSSPTSAGSLAPSICAPGTDCDDCGHRPICVSCPSECSGRMANGHDDFCLEEMLGKVKAAWANNDGLSI